MANTVIAKLKYNSSNFVSFTSGMLHCLGKKAVFSSSY